ncbi:hypothetical protein FRC08_003154 [Ceratobasidium sp. 394]|nr:hypothetical protein FRC08_003154 [Ceratobasidium sp. 394]
MLVKERGGGIHSHVRDAFASGPGCSHASAGCQMPFPVFDRPPRRQPAAPDPYVFADHLGEPIPIFLHKDLGARDALAQLVTAGGGELVQTMRQSVFLIVDPMSSDGQDTIDGYGDRPDKRVLRPEWLQICVAAGRIVIANDWADSAVARLHVNAPPTGTNSTQRTPLNTPAPTKPPHPSLYLPPHPPHPSHTNTTPPTRSSQDTTHPHPQPTPYPTRTTNQHPQPAQAKARSKNAHRVRRDNPTDPGRSRRTSRCIRLWRGILHRLSGNRRRL